MANPQLGVIGIHASSVQCPQNKELSYLYKYILQKAPFEAFDFKIAYGSMFPNPLQCKVACLYHLKNWLATVSETLDPPLHANLFLFSSMYIFVTSFCTESIMYVYRKCL